MNSPSKASILMIGNHFIDGNQNAWQELAKRLGENGYRVMTTSATRNKLLRWVDMLATIFTNRQKIDIAQIDVFSGSAFLWAFSSGLLLKSLRMPFILTLHGGGLPSFSKNHPKIMRWFLEQAMIVTAPSGYLKEQMKVYRKDIQLIPNALDVPQYTYSARENIAPCLIWLRAFHQIYNPVLAVEVVKILVSQKFDVSIRMVGPDKGDGAFHQVLKSVTDLGLSERFVFTGGVPKDQVPRELNKGDIFINTTNVDNTPISVMEAMACGLCIVSTNVGGIPYLLEDGVDALLVPPNDAPAMAGAVKRLLTEPGLAEKLSANARMKAETFDWSVVLPQWLSLLEKVVKK